ncbi:MAG: 4-hydroxy-tetrahydrodipicolinate reductase [Actinobacteria bacterium]|nr:4-hydroxy-tetrahydrodipicolinate reductase [Actinomycetota bacterium]MCL6104735.1 4-hydroxy-tetrahydrodipicolinate reductase [Actinomycetota bacterium]
MVRVGVLGAGGKMGSYVCKAVENDPDLLLVSAVDPAFDGQKATPTGDIVISKNLDTLIQSQTEVAVDFTYAQAARESLKWCAAHGINMVMGTTGFGDEELIEFNQLFQTAKSNCIIASNFAIGAVLMMNFAAQAARFMDGVEIVELHHQEKIDAPSGTSIATAFKIANSQDSTAISYEPQPSLPAFNSARGVEGPGTIRIHSVRLPGLVAHQEVIFGALGQTLTIRHDSYDRQSFMPGVLMAVKAVADRPGLTVGLDDLLGLPQAR